MLQAINPVYYVITGDPFTLNCTATNDPQSPNELRFRWFTESIRVDHKPSRWTVTELLSLRNTLTVISQLVITNLMVEQHNGTYTCSVDNFRPRAAVDQTTTIVVESKHSCIWDYTLMLVYCLTVPATITTHPLPAIIVFNGSTVSLSCEATGSGPIRYQWRRVNGEISSDKAEGVNTSTLTISSVTEQDEDKYYCAASNGGMNGLLYNNSSQRTIIIVYGESMVVSRLATLNDANGENILFTKCYKLNNNKCYSKCYLSVTSYTEYSMRICIATNKFLTY